MDFQLNEAQQALRSLAQKIFKELCTPRALTELEAAAATTGAAVVHDALWNALARAELLGLGLAEDVGGAGYGCIEMCLLLEQAGAVAAPLPLHSAWVAGTLVDHFGTETQRQQLLPALSTGQATLSVALSETGEPPVLAQQEAAGWRLRGVRSIVPGAHRAQAVLLPAQLAGRLAWFILAPNAPGVRLERQLGTNEEVFARLHLDTTLAESARLGGPAQGLAIQHYALQRARLGQCALALGLASAALALTAAYASEREQFGKPIGAFQAVAQRAGDAYVDVETMRVTLWRVAWLLDQGQPAQRELLVASYWSAEGAHRVLNAAQHIHGGVGFDRSYPLYRYFLQVRQLELTLGSASSHLAQLGTALARAGNEP